MTIKELKEELSKYDDDINVLFWGIENGYYSFMFVDDDPLQTHNRVDIILNQKESEWKTMQPLEILLVSLITLIFFTFLYLLLSFLFGSKDTHENDQTNDYLTPQEKQQLIDQFRNNYGWLSPEAQQKILKGKYISPQTLERDLEFYNQDEYIGKFSKGDEKYLLYNYKKGGNDNAQ